MNLDSMRYPCTINETTLRHYDKREMVVFIEVSLPGTKNHQFRVVAFDAESHLTDSEPSAISRTCFQQSIHLLHHAL
jgi:hypothetical protein